MSCPRLPFDPSPSMTMVLTALILSPPPTAAAASLMICCSGGACVQPLNAAAVMRTSRVMRFIENSLASRGNGIFHPEQRKVDGIGHRLISGVARMQIVARLVLREKFRRLIRIPDGRVEVDDPVVFLACPNPLVERRSFGLALGRKLRGALEWRERGPVDLQTARVSTHDQLAVRANQIGGRGQRVGA